MSSKQDFLKASVRRFQPLQGLERWGLSAQMRSITEAEKSAHDSALEGPDGKIDPDRGREIKIRALILGLVDAQHEPLFRLEDLPALLHPETGLDAGLVHVCFEQLAEFWGFADYTRAKNSLASPAA